MVAGTRLNITLHAHRVLFFIYWITTRRKPYFLALQAPNNTSRSGDVKSCSLVDRHLAARHSPKGHSKTFPSSSSYSSSGAEPPLIGSFGLLNDDLPLCTGYPSFDLHLTEVLYDDVLPFTLGPSSWSRGSGIPFKYILSCPSYRHSLYMAEPA